MKFLSKKNIKMAMIFFMFYLMFLVVTLPAKVIPYFIPENSGVNITNLHGSLWDGEAGQLAYQREHLFNNVKWTINWSALFTLKMKLNLQFDNGRDGLSGKGSVSIGLFGLSVEDVMLDTSANEILKLSKQRIPAKISGPVSIVIRKASQGEPFCNELDAQLSWQNATVLSDFGVVKLNNPTINLTCDNGDVVAKLIQDSDEISTNATVILKKGNVYQLNGSVKGKDKLDPNIKQTLGWIGPKNADGSTSFNLSGKL